LSQYGPEGVLRGIGAVKASGSSYVPNLNKFIGYCMQNYSQSNAAHGEWESCPYTGRRRRLKPGYELLAERLGSKDDPRTHDQIRQDIETYIADGQP